MTTPMPAPYWLSKWSHYIRIRDNHKCVFCEEDAKKVSSTVLRRHMTAHHLDGKQWYPGKALDLCNGVTCCTRCHYEIVHTSLTSSKKWRAFFKRYVCYAVVRRFNEKWQYKLDGGYK